MRAYEGFRRTLTTGFNALGKYLLLILILAAPHTAYPAVVVVETEPNDTPASATPIAGEVTLMGAMTDQDQDAFSWTVSDNDAAKRWTLELHGIPGRLTIIQIARITYNEAGEVTGARRFFKMGTRDGSLPSIHSDLIFEPGEYLLGLAAAGGGDGIYRPPSASLSFGDTESNKATNETTDKGGYRVYVTAGDKIPASSDTQHHDIKTARPVRLGKEVTTFLSGKESTWYRIDFKDSDTTSRWDVKVRVPVGRKVRARLTQADGKLLSKVTSDIRGGLVLPDLALPPGSYYLEIEPVFETDEIPGFIQTLKVVAVGQRIDGGEAEPNSKWAQANRVELDNCCSGRISENNDTDFFAFTLDEKHAEQLLEINLDTGADKSLKLCLLSATGTTIQCRDGKGQIVLGNLLLPRGDYGFSIGRGKIGTEYSVHFRATGSPKRGYETEPNDTLAYATGTPSNNRIKGTFDEKGDVDFYRFVVTANPQLWRVQVIGDNIAEIIYHDGSGHQNQRVRPPAGQKRVRLENLFLMPGIHYISVRARKAGEYTLLARALGPPDPNGELEPNDDTSRMQLLRIGQTRTGLLHDSEDQDNYRFYLADWDHITLIATPPPDGQLNAAIHFNGRPMRQHTSAAGPLVLQGVFPPGDYRLVLTPEKTSDAEYTLSLARNDRFACPDDCEPNDSSVFASPVPADRKISGRTGEWKDNDWYVLPAFETARSMALQFTTKRNVTVLDEDLKPLKFDWDKASSAYRGALVAGSRTYIKILGSRRHPEYSLAVLLEDESTPPAPIADTPVTLALELETGEVAAYERIGQTVAGTLTLRNTGTEPLSLTLDTAVSDARWKLSVDDAAPTIPPGGTHSIPVRVAIPADAWADIPVRLSIRASTDAGGGVSTFAELSAGRDTPPVNPVRAWAIPEALRGGMNVSRTALGATSTSSPAQKNLDSLFDGIAVSGQGPAYSGGRKAPVEISVDLPGSAPVPVAGFAVNPLSRRHTTYYPRAVEFQLSDDGTNYETVTTGVLAPTHTEQFFALQEPVTARFARLLLTSNWSGEQAGQIILGEWKVIAAPGYDPFGGSGLNIADPALGGHVAWAKPWISSNWDSAVLTEKEEKRAVRVNQGQRLEWVVGFHHNRAALIDSIEWHDSSRKGNKIDQVSLSASLDSPVGPWQPLGEWSRSKTGDKFVFETPGWARYLRFSAPPAEDQQKLDPPETLTIRERPTGDDYRSVLSEWGFASQSAFYESTQPLPLRAQLIQRGNESRATAAPLNTGKPEAGIVQLDKQTQWYRSAVPDDQNTLVFTLTGDPTVRTELSLSDSDGKPLVLRKRTRESSSDTHVLEATVEPGSDVFIEVHEPPRNVLFLWDTSASVGAYLPVIYNSLIAYAEDLVPGRDAANFLPFGSSTPLMRDWYGEPYLLQMILNDYPRRENSSAAEQTQLNAAQALAPRAGTKAIVMVTDAATSRDAAMWDIYKTVQPRVFALGVSSDAAFGRNPPLEQDLMQDWSRVNGGHYTHLLNEGEMEVAFDRAATLLRRPANYQLTMETMFQEAPGPGSLVVTAGNSSGDTAPAVELILDASGSMLKRMDGRRRIDIAREVLTTALREQIPAGTPTALRVFGHRTPNACETDLVIPLKALDTKAAVAMLAQIEAKNLAKTPIADSLAAVKQDLKKAKGPAVVMLVTDGEETCDGDPEAVLKKLEEAGFAISLNIVGFAIDDEALAAQFRTWAEAGGGRYFAASDATGLDEAVTQALSTPYTVYDAAGEPVAEGVVGGEPVSLEQGVYRVMVTTTPPREFTGVEILGETAISLADRKNKPRL